MELETQKTMRLLKGDRVLKKRTVQASNAQIECSTVVSVEPETVTFLNIDEVQPSSVQLSHIPQLFQI